MMVFIFINSATTPAPKEQTKASSESSIQKTVNPMDNSKLASLVDAETTLRTNLMSDDYDKELFASEFADLRKAYKSAVGEDLPSGPMEFLESANHKKANGGSVTSGSLYVGAFKYMNAQAAEKQLPNSKTKAETAMHNKYLGK